MKENYGVISNEWNIDNVTTKKWNNDQQTLTKPYIWTTRTSHKTRDELKYFGRVSSSFSTNDIYHVILINK